MQPVNLLKSGFRENNLIFIEVILFFNRLLYKLRAWLK